MPHAIDLHKGQAQMTLLPERGGLLRKLTLEDSRGEPVDMLWNAPDFDATGSGWPMGGMPFLFPFAGRLFHEGQPLRYMFEGQVRHMPLHGFAYAVPWKVAQVEPSALTMMLEDSPGTQLLYPFAFAIRVHYQLESSHLKVRVQIENRGHLGPHPRPMPIAPGWHPFFNIPLRPLSRLEECILETSASHKVRVTPQGAAGKSAPYPEDPVEQGGRLSEPVYQNLILAHHQTGSISVHDRDSKLSLGIAWEPFDAIRYVVLWSREHAGFHCVEPWMSLPDPLASGHQVKWLENGESFTFTTMITLGSFTS